MKSEINIPGLEEYIDRKILQRVNEQMNLLKMELITPRSLKQSAHPIIASYCADNNLSEKELISKSRKSTLVDHRAIVCGILKVKGYSTPEIGEYLNRDHSTVLHSLKRAQNFYQTENEFKNRFDNALKLY